MRTGSRRRPIVPLLGLASVLLAARLFLPAAALAFSPRAAAEFDATGLPHWTRLALALPEMVGGLLLALPATFYPGALVLALDLRGAVAAHWSLSVPPARLYLFLAALFLLSGLRSRLGSSGPGARHDQP